MERKLEFMTPENCKAKGKAIFSLLPEPPLGMDVEMRGLYERNGGCVLELPAMYELRDWLIEVLP